MPRVLEAAASPSPGSVATRSTRASRSTDALDRLDRALREHGPSVVIAALDAASCRTLLQHVDRTSRWSASGPRREQLGTLAAEHAIAGQPVEVVLVRGRSCRATPATPARARADAVRGDARGSLPATDRIAWLGRHLARTKLGLALGAGGAKGYAHVGALQVLEEAGYAVDFVSGSSIGAIVGTWIAFGMDAARDRARACARRSRPRPWRRRSRSRSSGQVERARRDGARPARRSPPGARFDDTMIPLAIMTADLTTREPAPMREGPLDEALIAATALAGVFPPHERDGHRLVDGLAIDPVPDGRRDRGRRRRHGRRST